MDNLFKALLIIILGAFLYLYYVNSENERYIQHTGESPFAVLDTKTGKIYAYRRFTNLLIDPLDTTKEIEVLK